MEREVLEVPQFFPYQYSLPGSLVSALPILLQKFGMNYLIITTQSFMFPHSDRSRYILCSLFAKLYPPYSFFVCIGFLVGIIRLFLIPQGTHTQKKAWQLGIYINLLSTKTFKITLLHT